MHRPVKIDALTVPGASPMFGLASHLFADPMRVPPSHRTPATEVELKLAGDRRALSAAFAGLAGDAVCTRALRSTYYDTPDGALWRRGYTLRVRETGADGGPLMTLKEERGGGLERGEWNARVPSPRPQLALLPDEVRQSAMGGIDARGLAPRFVTDVERRSAGVRTGGARVEVSLDTGRVVAGDRELPVAELEFELLSGPASGLLAAARLTVEERRLVVRTRSKAARGMTLLTGDAPAATARVPRFSASDTVATALGQVAATTATHLLGNVDVCDGEHPERVHQLRVALRRLRSALYLFRGRLTPAAAGLGKDARWAFRRLGPARDLDVFLEESLPAVRASVRSGDAGLLVETAEARRDDAYRAVDRLLGARRFNRLLLDLLGAAADSATLVRKVGEPLADAAPAVLDRGYGRVVDAGADFGRLSMTARHNVRVLLKRFGYGCDSLHGLYPGATTRGYRRRLARLQRALGAANDAWIAQRIADTLAVPDAAARAAAGIVETWARERLAGMEANLTRAWREFVAREPFWHVP